MEYLNHGSLGAVSRETFQNQHPYPWLKIPQALTEQGFRSLCLNMPDISLFNRDEGVKRAYGQAPHDRYSMHYRPGLTIPQPWAEFLAELQGDAYQSFVRRVLGVQSLLFTFEWHHTWQGCSVRRTVTRPGRLQPTFSTSTT